MGAISRLIVAALFATALGSGPAAGAFPDKPIRMILSFPPGGSSDAIARIVQPGLERELGQPIIIDNRPGAGGTIAIDAVAKAAPDGHTIGLGGAGALGPNTGVQAMPYDPRKDLSPVTNLAASPFILAGSTQFAGKSLRDIIAQAKQSGQTLSIGHGGNGTLMHLTAELFNKTAGTNISLVPYRGMAPVMNDLMGGHVTLGIVDPPSAITAIEGKKVAAIAISSPQRFATMPDIPTFAESLPGFESLGWFGIVAPAATPADVIAKLNAAFVKVLNDPAIVKQIRALGSEPMPMTPAEFGAFIDKEIAKWSPITSGIGK